MLDGVMRTVIDPPLALAGRLLAGRGIGADRITGLGLALGLGSALAITARWDGLALVLLLASRLCDGLDGAVARAASQTGTPGTPRGGFLDIVADFVFYGAIPLAFGLREPAFALPAAVLLFTFYVNGASFLAYAAAAAKAGLAPDASRGPKALHFTGGLAEGTETILVFVAMILWPSAFPILAYGFAMLVLVTAASRVILAWKTLPGG